MRALKHLFEKNQSWVRDMTDADPDFFKNLSHQQNPEYLWIGCSDSRVPATQIVGLLPGQVFVHRNIANLVLPGDLNALAVIHYAIEMLKVKHIIVCGHYGCGGITAAFDEQECGLVDHWLQHIKKVEHKYADRVEALEDRKAKINLLCELNVREQVVALCQIQAVQEAWRSGQELAIHGWIYNIANGILKDLDRTVTCQNEGLR